MVQFRDRLAALERLGTAMRLHTLETELWLPRDREDVFLYFSRPENLEFLTPPWLHFKLLTSPPAETRAGTRLEYRLRLRGVPVRWVSEITVWEPPHRFVDEQRRGPYRRWVHEHRFEEEDHGTVIRDRVEYAVHGGALVNWLFVALDLRRIFSYRRARLRKLFGKGR